MKGVRRSGTVAGRWGCGLNGSDGELRIGGKMEGGSRKGRGVFDKEEYSEMLCMGYAQNLVTEPGDASNSFLTVR